MFIYALAVYRFSLNIGSVICYRLKSYSNCRDDTDNKQWKLSCYGNYRKWQQSAGYLLPHLHFFCPHPLTAFLVGCIKPYAPLISIAQTDGDLFFTMALPERIIHLFPSSLCFNCSSALPGWLPHSVLSGVGNLKYRLELVTLNTHIFSHCYNTTDFLLCPIHGLNVSQIFHQGSRKGPDFTG